MNKKVKKLWVTALRSGKYKQGKSRLKISDGQFCCLGVLCDLYIQKTKKGAWGERPDDTPIFIGTDGNIEECVLPCEVQEWAGIDSEDPYLTHDSEGSGNRTAADINDHGANDKKVTFKGLATRIEKVL